MNWNDLLAEQRVERQPTDKAEIDGLRDMVDENLRDAAVPGLSAKGRFAMTYEAARLLSVMVIRCAGFRIRHQGGAHYNTFLALQAVGHDAIARRSNYYQVCREKRNLASYERPSVITEAETSEIVRVVKEFQRTVESWISRHHRKLAKS